MKITQMFFSCRIFLCRISMAVMLLLEKYSRDNKTFIGPPYNFHEKFTFLHKNNIFLIKYFLQNGTRKIFMKVLHVVLELRYFS